MVQRCVNECYRLYDSCLIKPYAIINVQCRSLLYAVAFQHCLGIVYNKRAVTLVRWVLELKRKEKLTFQFTKTVSDE
jgi:hypothetical protein